MKTYSKLFFLLFLIYSCNPDDELVLGVLTTHVEPENSGTITKINQNDSNVIQLQAVPAEHYLFKGWQQENNTNPLITENIIYVVMDTDKAITAVFELKDTDEDGVTDNIDVCPNTPKGENVDANGCSDTEKDTDEDGVTDDIDVCPNTSKGENVDANGCSDTEKDTDEDGVTDDIDVCPNTPKGENVDVDGCSDTEKDTDKDGVTDNIDICPNTPEGENADANGCSNSQKTYVPDDNFEQYLIDQGFDDILDDYVITNFNNVTYLLFENSKIKDFTGIEDFSSLESFQIHSSDIESLDLSSNTNLNYLYVFRNDELKSVILGQHNLGKDGTNTQIQENNSLETLDMGESDFSTTLYARFNPALKTIIVSGLTNLQTCDLSNNQLTNLDVKAVTYLVISNNPITSLNASGATNLTTLEFYGTGTTLTNVDVSGTALTSLDFNNFTLLESLNVSGTTALTSLQCRNTKISSLDVSDSNNLSYLHVQYTPNLTCIQVNASQLASMPIINWYKDAIADYNITCP